MSWIVSALLLVVIGHLVIALREANARQEEIDASEGLRYSMAIAESAARLDQVLASEAGLKATCAEAERNVKDATDALAQFNLDVLRLQDENRKLREECDRKTAQLIEAGLKAEGSL